MSLQQRVFGRYLDDGEKIVSVAHRHVLVFKFAAAKSTFFGLFIPAVLYVFFPKLVLVWVAWSAVGLLAVLYHFLDWYFDAWIMTTDGVVDIERNGLFDVTSTRIDYHMIEGISYTVKGVIQTIFNYGDITIDKLGAKTSVVLKDAANPKKLERKVMKYQEKYVYERSVRDHQALKTMLSDMIAYHVHNDKLDK